MTYLRFYEEEKIFNNDCMKYGKAKWELFGINSQEAWDSKLKETHCGFSPKGKLTEQHVLVTDKVLTNPFKP